MSAAAKAKIRDEIRVFMPTIGEEELALRARMRALRNTASAMICKTESGTARQLAWIVTEYATEALYTPMESEALTDLNKFFNRLLLTAVQAEQIDTLGPGE